MKAWMLRAARCSMWCSMWLMACTVERADAPPLAAASGAGEGTAGRDRPSGGPPEPPLDPGSGPGTDGQALDDLPASEQEMPDGPTADGGDAMVGPDAMDAMDVAGSGPAVDAGNPDDAGNPATGPAPTPNAWSAGDYPPDLMAPTYLELSGVAGQKGYTRQYKVHVPPGYDSATPTPLVFCIHGLTQDPILFCAIGSGLVDKSDAEGFILVMPNGYGASWNGGTCCGAASVEQLDDVALMRAIFEEVSQHLNVDRSRVFATGHSNGGFMTYRLACEASDIFTAVAPSAGGIGTNDLSIMDAMWDIAGSSALGATNLASDFIECAPTHPVSVLDMHGTLDGLVPHSFQAPSLALLAARNGCDATTEPATAPMSEGDTTCVSHTGCPDGLEVTGCTVQDGGHNWFGSPDCGTAAGELGCAIVGYNSTVLVATDAAWDFFSRHTR